MARVKLTRDLLEAYIVLEPYEALSPVEAMTLLAHAEVIHGLDTDAVIKLERLKGPLEHRVAVGEAPIHGQDAVIDYRFRTERAAMTPAIGVGGKADYRDLGLVTNVEAGALLAVRTPPVAGRDGVNVKGQRVIARPPRNKALRAGEGAMLSSDGVALFAASPGCPRLEPDGTVTVARKYRVPGHVGLQTGHIDFDGDLEILGDVEPQMIVRASGHVTISGSAIGCRVNAGKSLAIHGKALAGAVVTALGDMTIGFAEYATLTCGGTLSARENLIHCEVSARDAVKAGGSIVGGSVTASASIRARVLGAPMGVPTRLVVDPGGPAREALAAIASERAELRVHLARLSACIRQAQEAFVAAETSGAEADRLRELLQAFRELSHRDGCLAEREAATRATLTAAPGRIEASEVIHPEVEVFVGEGEMRVEEPISAQSLKSQVSGRRPT